MAFTYKNNKIKYLKSLIDKILYTSAVCNSKSDFCKAK